MTPELPICLPSGAPRSLAPVMIRIMRTRWSLGGIVAAGLTLTACSYSYDAWFANPCGTSLEVRTYYAEQGADGALHRSDELIASATLAANAVTNVEDAFQDAGGFTWFITIGDAAPMGVTKADMPHWVVSVPASACTAAIELGELDLYERGGTTIGSVYITSTFDLTEQNDRLRHESKHADQWATFGIAIVPAYGAEEMAAARAKRVWDTQHRKTGESVDSSCFNSFEVDAGTDDGGYGIKPGGGSCPSS